MRRYRSIASIVSYLSVCLIVGTATAAPPDDGPGKDRRARREGGPPAISKMMEGMPLIKALDADADGTISAQEIDNAAVRLRSLDKDGDGALSARELMPQRRGQGRPGQDGEAMQRRGRKPEGGQAGSTQAGPDPAMMSKIFKNRDGDGDGKLTGDEVPERMRERLDRIDADKDGSITLEEMESAMSKMRGRGKRKGGKADKAETGTPGGERPRRPPAE